MFTREHRHGGVQKTHIVLALHRPALLLCYDEIRRKSSEKRRTKMGKTVARWECNYFTRAISRTGPTAAPAIFAGAATPTTPERGTTERLLMFSSSYIPFLAR